MKKGGNKSDGAIIKHPVFSQNLGLPIEDEDLFYLRSQALNSGYGQFLFAGRDLNNINRNR